MRILVAGGAGFIGGHLCRALLAEGHEVICLDNFCTGTPDNVADLLDNPAFDLIEADVTDAPDLPVDLILHLASPASPVHYRALSLETMFANALGARRLLDLAVARGARFLYTSTSEVYGDPLVHPQPESYWGNVNPTGPRACYDESKRFTEALTTEYRRRYGVNATIVRLFNTYGPRMAIADGRVVPEFIAAALRGDPLPVQGDGAQTRSFCYVSDTVDAIIQVALDTTADGEILNIGNPEERTVLDLGHLIARAAGTEPRFHYLPAATDDPARRRPDISRIHARYGWGPRVAIEDGLRATVADFRQRLDIAAPAPVEVAR